MHPFWSVFESLPQALVRVYCVSVQTCWIYMWCPNVFFFLSYNLIRKHQCHNHFVSSLCSCLPQKTHYYSAPIRLDCTWNCFGLIAPHSEYDCVLMSWWIKTLWFIFIFNNSILQWCIMQSPFRNKWSQITLGKMTELSENWFHQTKKQSLNEIWGNFVCFLPWLMHISVP